MRKFPIIALTLVVFGSSAVLAQAQTAAATSDGPTNPAVKDTHDGANRPLATGANSFTMTQAKEHIEKEGYTGVSGLSKDHSGLWRGRAMKGGKRVHVALDFKGVVTSR